MSIFRFVGINSLRSRYPLDLRRRRARTNSVYDFAGGIVVHISAGVAALVAALVPRYGFPNTPMLAHNLTMTMTVAGRVYI